MELRSFVQDTANMTNTRKLFALLLSNSKRLFFVKNLSWKISVRPCVRPASGAEGDETGPRARGDEIPEVRGVIRVSVRVEQEHRNSPAEPDALARFSLGRSCRVGGASSGLLIGPCPRIKGPRRVQKNRGGLRTYGGMIDSQSLRVCKKIQRGKTCMWPFGESGVDALSVDPGQFLLRIRDGIVCCRVEEKRRMSLRLLPNFL